jgi:hypothetical protein
VSGFSYITDDCKCSSHSFMYGSCNLLLYDFELGFITWSLDALIEGFIQSNE